MKLSLNRAFCVAALFVFCAGLTRAVVFKFREKETAFREAARAKLKASGMTYGVAKITYFTPQVGLVISACVSPGGTAEVSVKGKFAPGTKFIFENDNVNVLKESLTATEYRATVQAPPNIGPQTANVRIMSDYTALSAEAMNVLQIGGNWEWNINAGNGWKVIARSRGKSCPAAPQNASGELLYDLSFYHAGETQPFEKREAMLYYSMWDSENYRFGISQTDQKQQAAQEDMQALVKQMMNPNLTDAQRAALMTRVQKAQEQQLKQVQEMTNPANVQKMQAARDRFGCENIYLQERDMKLTGRMRCAPKVGERIPITGVVTRLP